jgi:acetate kinase
VTDSGSVAVINAGSSSVKFALYSIAGESELLFRGQIEGIGVNPCLTVRRADGRMEAERSWPAAGFDHNAATREILATGATLASGTRVVAIGHRVVHGGLEYNSPVLINPEILHSLEQLIPLAPLHQPHNLAPIRTIFEEAPNIRQVACFDTAFHRNQSRVAQSYGLPRSFTQSGVRRYGFHGLSFEYLTSRMRDLCPEIAMQRVILAHLGNGASLCAVNEGRSVATTMGFSSVEGLLMGTRCGALDPGVILYLMQEHQMDVNAIEDLIYRKSGLLGASGLSSDMRMLRNAPDHTAREAIDLFIYRILRETGSLVSALGGIDAFVFSGGIGENDAETRTEVIAGLRWTGALLDTKRNAARAGCISTSASRIPVWVIPTDEEATIARHTARVLAKA